MPLIKPRTRGKQFVRLITRLDRENNEALYAYAHFIGESPEYVLNQLVETVLAKDKEFVSWRAEHSESYVPLPVRERRKQKQAAHRSIAHGRRRWRTRRHRALSRDRCRTRRRGKQSR